MARIRIQELRSVLSLQSYALCRRLVSSFWGQGDLRGILDTWTSGSELRFADLAAFLTGAEVSDTRMVLESTEIRGLRVNVLYGKNASLYGLDVALWNEVEEHVTGVQIGGIVNEAEELVGLQIGLLNFNKSGPLPFFPILNFGF